MKRIVVWSLTALCMLVFCMPAGAVVEMNEESGSYVFGGNMHTVDAPTAYTVQEILKAEDFGAQQLVSLDDLSVAEDGSIFLADGDAGTVYKLSADRSSTLRLQSFSVGNTTVTLQKPVGVFASRAGEVYVADRTAGYIYIFDMNFQYKRSIAPPAKEDFFSEQAYEPLKICADAGGRTYVISANQTQGILQFSPEGEFIGFLGATRVQPTAGELLLRLFATEEQKDSLLRLIPTEYNNLDVDEDSFIYASISALEEYSLYSNARSNGDSATPIRRLNPKGEDELLRQSTYPPMGDVNFLLTYQAGKGNNSEELRGPSKIIDTSCRTNGVYSLLDNSRGRIYTYNRTGDLLFICGGPGDKRDQLVTPTALDYWGNSLVVSDQGSACVKIFAPTPYAEKVLEAIDYHEEGNYEAESAVWAEVKREYIGSELAYLGLGKAEYTLKNYQEAMDNFRLADNKTYYSKAYKAYRKEWGYAHIGWLLGGAAAVIAALALVSYIVRKKMPVHEGDPETFAQRVGYGKSVLFHPFKSFWDLKVRHIGTLPSATAILAAAVLLNLLQTATAPYLLQDSGESRNILLQGFFGIILLVGLFVLANWCLTSLMDGKGTARDIYIYTCYSLTPLVILTPIQIVLGQIISLDEMALYQFFSTFGMILVIFLLFVGTLTVHDYSFGKTVGMLLLTAIGMMILVFIAMLCVTLFQQIVLYIENIVKELQLR